jgi:hypothetical protein
LGPEQPGAAGAAHRSGLEKRLNLQETEFWRELGAAGGLGRKRGAKRDKKMRFLKISKFRTFF